MARTQFSLKSAHLLMWSSPILLLVLVFTLTSTTTSKTPNRPTTTVTVAHVSATTTTEPVTIPATKTTTPVVATASTIPPRRPVDNNFSSATRSTERPVASAPNANAMNGELSGTLGPALAVVDVPLRGPGSWTLTTSASTSQTLSCGSVASPVTSQVVVGDAQICQLEITSATGEASTWQLTPTT